jgi:hypothetical protein
MNLLSAPLDHAVQCIVHVVFVPLRFDFLDEFHQFPREGVAPGADEAQLVGAIISARLVELPFDLVRGPVVTRATGDADVHTRMTRGRLDVGRRQNRVSVEDDAYEDAIAVVVARSLQCGGTRRGRRGLLLRGFLAQFRFDGKEQRSRPGQQQQKKKTRKSNEEKSAMESETGNLSLPGACCLLWVVLLLCQCATLTMRAT